MRVLLILYCTLDFFLVNDQHILFLISMLSNIFAFSYTQDCTLKLTDKQKLSWFLFQTYDAFVCMEI